MKEIKLFFTDFWSGFQNDGNFILNALKNRYRITIDAKNPDYLFYSSFGIRHFNYPHAVKIYFTGENDVPDFNSCDYGIGSAHLNFGNRYFRLPIYVLYEGYEDILVDSGHALNLKQSYAQRKFCNFVYSNNQKADPVREEFYRRLSQSKKVDSGGRSLNNIGRPVADKIDFIKDYKFTIAFENSSLSGYTTEKLLDPMRVNSLPVYWGNPDVGWDFNAASFINVHDYVSMEQVVQEIIFLDTNDAAYLEKLSQPWIKQENGIDIRRRFVEFLSTIMDLPLSQARKTTDYGYNALYTIRQHMGGLVYNNTLLRPFFKKIIRK